MRGGSTLAKVRIPVEPVMAKELLSREGTVRPEMVTAHELVVEPLKSWQVMQSWLLDLVVPGFTILSTVKVKGEVVVPVKSDVAVTEVAEERIHEAEQEEYTRTGALKESLHIVGKLSLREPEDIRGTLGFGVTVNEQEVVSATTELAGVPVQVMIAGLTERVIYAAQILTVPMNISREAVSVMAICGLMMFASESPRVMQASVRLFGKKLLILMVLAETTMKTEDSVQLLSQKSLEFALAVETIFHWEEQLRQRCAPEGMVQFMSETVRKCCAVLPAREDEEVMLEQKTWVKMSVGRVITKNAKQIILVDYYQLISSAKYNRGIFDLCLIYILLQNKMVLDDD